MVADTKCKVHEIFGLFLIVWFIIIRYVCELLTHKIINQLKDILAISRLANLPEILSPFPATIILQKKKKK